LLASVANFGGKLLELGSGPFGFSLTAEAGLVFDG
jgi:hypothetical protein